MRKIKKILIALLLISALIFFHELGHLVIGKWTGLNPTDFSIGFGKTLLSFEFWDVRWHISMIPLGGYVAFEEILTTTTNPEIARAWVLTAAAGPIANLIIFIVLHLWIMNKFLSTFSFNEAKEKPLRLGRFEKDKDFSDQSNKLFLMFTKDKRISPMTPEELEEFQIDPEMVNFQRKLRFKEKLKISLKNSLGLIFPVANRDFFFIQAYSDGLDKKELNMPEGLIGPIGILQSMGKSVDGGWVSSLFFTANISMSLFVFNLIPLGILDGGQILKATLIYFELLSENANYSYVNISVAILLLLFIVVLSKDILRIVRKK